MFDFIVRGQLYYNVIGKISLQFRGGREGEAKKGGGGA